MSDLHDRAAGALLGVHVGDALGAACEFMTPAEIADRYPLGVYEITGGGAFGWSPGEATDDTDLTKAVLDAYAADPEHVVRGAADRMLAWLRTRPRDIGGATRAGLAAYASSQDPADAGSGEGSAGNGSLMRTIPVALARADDALRRSEAAAISAITHDDPRCVGACVAYCDLVHLLVEGTEPGAAVDAVLADESLDDWDPRVRRAIRFGTDLAPESLRLANPTVIPAMIDGPYAGGGYVLDALTIAVGALLTPDEFEDVLPMVVELGGDTDTNGAIAGGLLGARDGLGAIPVEWLAPLEFGEHFRASVPRLLDLRTG